MPSRPPTLKLKKTAAPSGPRPSPTARGYGREWKRVRAWKLAHNPLCEDCREPATEVDHVVSLAKGGTHDEGNLRSLCKSCHSRKTFAVDGSFGRGKE